MPNKPDNRTALEKQGGRYTPEQMIKMGDALHARISEVCDGYLFIGFVAGAKNEPIHLNVYGDSKTGLALQKFLEEIVVPSLKDYEDDEDDGDDWKRKQQA